MPQDAVRASVAELGAAYRSGTLDPVEVTRALLDRVAAHPHGHLVYRRVTEERALRQAEHAARLFAAGVDLGPLQGVPVAVKDNLDMAGEVTAAGSKVLLRRPPAPEDAPVLARLDAAGAVFVGRTNMTELAYSGVGVNPHFGTPPCALDETRVPGGSSSGTGVAVAAGLATVGVGSDTGGSVRIPAAVNGVVGLKTTDGLVPTAGAAPLSTTLDTIGPLARSCDDVWTLFTAMAAQPYAPLRTPGERLTLLAPTTLLRDELDPAVDTAFTAALGLLESLGHEVREAPLPALAEAPALYRRYGSFASHEALALYETELRERGDEMDPRVVKRILALDGKPATDYVRLSLAREALRRAFWPGLAGVDAVVGPTLPVLPPRVEELEEDAEYFRLNALMLRNTAPFNVLGCPAASVPCGRTSGGLSVGLMVATRPGEEELALGLAKQVEQAVAAGRSRGAQAAR
ncbi:MAG TPA: amidase family protein [Trueperaceae bacterium]|nr:amidase family protein [Trueperaceae bacterium]